METSILINGTVVVTAQVFNADANGQPIGDALTPSGPFDFVIADASIASFEQDDNAEGTITGLVVGSTSVVANITQNGVVAATIPGTIDVSQPVVNGPFVTQVNFGAVTPPPGS